MREDGREARGGSCARGFANLPGLASESEADPGQFANHLGFLPETGRNPRWVAPVPQECCERHALRGKTHATEHNKPPGFPPSLPPFATSQAARRAEPGGADAERRAEPAR